MMKWIIKILLLLTLIVSSSSALINECKSDLYYANGVGMHLSERDALFQWKQETSDFFLNDSQIEGQIAQRKIAYNQSQGFVNDLLESFEQQVNNEWTWPALTTFLQTYMLSHNMQDILTAHTNDLTKQIKQYKQSIKDGHGVIVVAHSQGNYFTNEAYDSLDSWMHTYFHMIGVATPANHVAGNGPYVTFDSDIINIVPTALPHNMHDINHVGLQNITSDLLQNIIWEGLQNVTSDVYQDFIAAYNAHDFYGSYLTSENSRNAIIGYIKDAINQQSAAPSQWVTDQEFNKNTMNYRITVKHRFDPSIVINDLVFPFNTSQKLYTVNYNGSPTYVKASCGGSSITPSWDGQQSNEYWLINNPEKEKISGEADYMRFQVTDALYPGNIDLNAVCKNTFGDTYRLADWSDFTNYSGSLSDVITYTHLDTKMHAWITFNGQRYYTSSRMYFISYYDHNVPSSYLVHASIDNNYLVVGSWGLPRVVACYDER